MWSEGKVRIRDIADELGVSTATVSNVLHGKTEKISERTVKAVERMLEERGYIPNMAAALLARNNSRIIGVVGGQPSLGQDRGGGLLYDAEKGEAGLRRRRFRLDMEP